MNVNLSEKGDTQVETEDNPITRIQALVRGYLLRKYFMRLDDNMTYLLLVQCLYHYNDNLNLTEKLNKFLSKKKIRNENFPSHISENIVKFAIFKKYGIMPCWDTNKGDAVINKMNIRIQIEIKGFMSDGPSSFGPTEMWDMLYFVDAKDTMNCNFKVYEIKLSNKNNVFRNIKLSKKETYGEIADSKRRPRGSFEKIFKPQLGDHCKLIFDGHISELDNTI